jgi:hypothetical protein
VAKAKATGSKSDEIRRLFVLKPNASGKEIVTDLKGRGIIVSEGLVYSLKPGTKKKKKGPNGKAKSAPSSNGVLSVGESIAIVKSAAEKMGWAAMKEIVDAMQ